MKIDRHVFLVITGTLAAVACAAEPAPPPVVPAADPAFAPVRAPDTTPAPTASAPPAPTVEAPPPPPPAPKPDPKTFASNAEEGCAHTTKVFNDKKTKCTDDKGALNCKVASMGYAASEGCNAPDDLVQAC